MTNPKNQHCISYGKKNHVRRRESRQRQATSSFSKTPVEQDHGDQNKAMVVKKE